MTRQGCSTFSTDESNRILDRLAGLEKIITPDRMRQALVATDRVNRHRCKLSNEVMLWVVLAMGLFTNLPIRQVFKHARRMRKEEESPPRSSYQRGHQVDHGAEPGGDVGHPVAHGRARQLDAMAGEDAFEAIQR